MTEWTDGTVEAYVYIECPDELRQIIVRKDTEIAEKDAIIQVIAKWGTFGGCCDGWDEQESCDVYYKEGKCEQCAIDHFTREVRHYD